MQRIMVATDLSTNHRDLFAVALRLAHASKAELRVVHVHDDDHPTDWRKLPTVRNLLSQWGMLEAGATLEDFEKLGLRVMPVDLSRRGDVSWELVVRAHDAHPDLVVLGTHGRVGLDRLMHPSVAEPVARSWGGPTLVVSERGDGLVDADGTLRINKVVIPIDASVDQQPVIDALTHVLQSVGVGGVEFVMVHVGKVDGIPSFELPDRTDWLWRSEVVDGSVVEGILEVAAVEGANLIAMGTKGHDSLMDTLRGSTTERVMRRAPCPVLVVPVR